jgi:hypothetical protein
MTEIININKVIQVVKVTSPKIQVATIGTQGPPGTGGDVTHGALNGLENDDHPQYHNDARGDARYYTKPQVDAGLAGKSNTGHGHGVADVAGLQSALDSKLDNSALALLPKTTQAVVDFGNAAGGESHLASVTVAAAWVADNSVILCNAAGVATPDHDAEDAALEGITAVAANLNEGVGFDVIARAPLGSWGRFNINIIGV